MSIDLESLIVESDARVEAVMACIDKNGKGVAFVVDITRRLLDTVTDGDLRRAILAHVPLDASIGAVLDQKRRAGCRGPLTAGTTATSADLLHLMTQHSVRQIPVVDEDGRVVDAMFLDDIVKAQELPLAAVIMAGGFGTRLRPLTESVPKPMLQVGGTPLLARIIRQLSDAGIRRVSVATHYKGSVIEDHFGDGREFGVAIEYINEDLPLGTAGALTLVDAPGVPVLVVNGDILADIDFRAMLRLHREHLADMTIAVRQHEVQIPYGVVEVDGACVTAIVEKPTHRYLISAGVYLVNPAVLPYIPKDRPYDMPELIEGVLATGGRVVAFPVSDYWLDIGQIDDYRKALADIRSGVARSK